MVNFIPSDEHKVQQLNENLQKKEFKNVSSFIAFYNSGLINKRHEDVLNFVKEITDAYQNVKEKNNRLVFLSENEILIEDLKARLEYWTDIVKIKREVNNLLEINEINNETILALTSEINGYLCVKTDEDNIVKISQEKLFSKMEDIIPAYHKYSSVKDDEAFEQNILFFKVADFMNIDDSFIKNIANQIPKK